MDFIKSSIDNLAKKQDKHNNVIERTFILERDMKTVYNSMAEIKANVRDVENKVDKTSQELRDKWDLVNENINTLKEEEIKLQSKVEKNTDYINEGKGKAKL